MRRYWLIAESVLVWLFIASTAGQAASPCPDTGGTEFIVDKPSDASLIAGGYNNTACVLTIKTTVTPSVATWIVDAKKINVLGPGVEIVNTAASSKVQLDADNGDILIQSATIKARSQVLLQCTGVAPQPPNADCRLDIVNSVVVVSPSLDVFNTPGDPSSGFSTKGNLDISTVGDINLQRSTIYAGSGLHVRSSHGGLTWFCPGGGLLPFCNDPANPGQIKFPCAVVFPDAAAVQNVCFPTTPPTICGGGFTESRFSVFKDIDISGSTLVFLNHATFTSVTGGLIAQPKGGSSSVITAAD